MQYVLLGLGSLPSIVSKLKGQKSAKYHRLRIVGRDEPVVRRMVESSSFVQMPPFREGHGIVVRKENISSDVY